jgi:hypothetical protein
MLYSTDMIAYRESAEYPRDLSHRPAGIDPHGI